MKPQLTPRAALALSTAGVSLFLLLCFAGYGTADAVRIGGPPGFGDRLASWFVGPLGAGAHVIAALGVAWGVIVYFQERTPDLVMRVAGAAVLAGSTAMIMGLVNGGERSVWAGTVGTAGASAVSSWGTFGSVLGWFVATALFCASGIFATDWLFRTLRRSGAAVFDPRAIATEPSRGDLLGDPAEAEPREFVREMSRAAGFAPAIHAEEPHPVEALDVAAETLPEGYSVHPVGARTFVRGPSGYERVEFLPPSDELAVPETPSSDAPSSDFVRVLDDDLEFTHVELADPVVGTEMGETTAELAGETTADLGRGFPEELPLTAKAPAPAPQRAVEAHRADAQRNEPRTGISLPVAAVADDSPFIDDVLTFPASFVDAAAGPHDGASAAGEIASALAPDTAEITAAPVTPAAEADAAPVAPVAPPPADVSEEPRFIDDVFVAEASLFDDDVLLVGGDASVGEIADFAPSAARAPAAVAEAADPVVAVVTAAPVAPVAVAEAPVADATAVEITTAVADSLFSDEEFSVLDAAYVAIEPEAQAAAAVAPELPRVEASIASEPEAEMPLIAAAVPAAEEFLDAAEADSGAAEEPTADVVVPFPAAFETPAAAAAPVAASVPAPVEASVEVAAEPAPAPAAAPAAEVPAVAPVSPPVAAPEAPAERPAQLKLFAHPACDFSKLAAMELDPLFHDAAKAILVRGRASAVVLQRVLGIGYARGLRILDQMTEAGMLGPDSAGGAREICFSQESWDAWTARA